MLRLAGIWQPSDAASRVTPSMLYQNRQEARRLDLLAGVLEPRGRAQFNTATPERVGGPDQYYLPALKVQWDLDKSSIIANASYYHRKEYTGYQGTVYDLSLLPEPRLAGQPGVRHGRGRCGTRLRSHE